MEGGATQYSLYGVGRVNNPKLDSWRTALHPRKMGAGRAVFR